MKNLLGAERIASGSVLVFLKEPRPGAVKTRLAAALGADEAARLYTNWTTTILRGLQSIRGRVTLLGYYAGRIAAVRVLWNDFVDEWLSQPEGDLGVRLARGFAATRSRGPGIAIGTDCLDVDAAVIDRAFVALTSSDSVLGPASDGGYYLLGLNRTAPGLFSGIEWSSPRTLEQQRAALQQAGMSIAELPMLHDIDTVDDWLAYQKRCTP